MQPIACSYPYYIDSSPLPQFMRNRKTRLFLFIGHSGRLNDQTCVGTGSPALAKCAWVDNENTFYHLCVMLV